MAAAKPKPKNALTRKVGPFPVWLLALAVLLAVYLFLRARSASASGGISYNPGKQNTPVTSSDDSGGGASSSGTSDNGLLTGVQGEGGQVDITGQTSSAGAPAPFVTAQQNGASPYTMVASGDDLSFIYSPNTSPANPSAAFAGSPGPSFGAPVGTTGTVTPFQSAGVYTPNVDPTGHVVSGAGTRVGGAADISG